MLYCSGGRPHVKQAVELKKEMINKLGVLHHAGGSPHVKEALELKKEMIQVRGIIS